MTIPVASLGKDCDSSCGAGAGAESQTSGMGTFGASLVLLARGVGSGRKLFFALVNHPLATFSMDPSTINSMAAARCELKPDEELRMMPETKAPSTEGFSLGRNSSYSISLVRLRLCGSYVSVMSCRESGMNCFVVKGEHSSCTILSLSSLDWISFRATLQSPIKPTYAKGLSVTALLCMWQFPLTVVSDFRLQQPQCRARVGR